VRQEHQEAFGVLGLRGNSPIVVSTVTQLLGRQVELGALEAVLGAGVREGSSAAAIVGDPGIGKSTLLAEALPRVTDRRTVIAQGRASEFERQLPFGVFIDALDAYLGRSGPEGCRRSARAGSR
jgi:predicted ATPase